MVSLAEIDPDAVWLILARLAWEGGAMKPPEVQIPKGLAPWSDLFPAPSVRHLHPTATALVAAALLQKVNQITPPWLAEAAPNAGPAIET